MRLLNASRVEDARAASGGCTSVTPPSAIPQTVFLGHAGTSDFIDQRHVSRNENSRRGHGSLRQIETPSLDLSPPRARAEGKLIATRGTGARGDVAGTRQRDEEKFASHDAGLRRACERETSVAVETVAKKR